MNGALLIILTSLAFLIDLSAQGIAIDSIETDKARYSPAATVNFGLKLSEISANLDLLIKYRHLNTIIEEQSFPISTGQSIYWSWQTPNEDYKGYLVEVFLIEADSVLDQINVAVDVSSSWKKYPRYGFLSKYPELSAVEMESVISKLNSYHINGLQFYDWHYKHHMPLKGTPANPAPFWNDVANRTNYFSTVSGYIDAAHNRNMKTMSYNLLYGALDNAGPDSVLNEWYLFKDPSHLLCDSLDLSFWGHYIYLLDPHNMGWKDYIFWQTEKVFLALPFDGWHIDQVGDRGAVWNYQGESIIIKDAFYSYTVEAKNYLGVNLVMNAVNQYGQFEIAQGPVDFLYTEVWSPNETFGDLATIILNNLNMYGDSLKTVLAAYVNHDLSENPGYFNTPAVLLANSVIFSFGGSHVELGEHMLGHEYFQNDNLIMNQELEQQLFNYYDFLVAYENLLRDHGNYSQSGLSTSGSIMIGDWPPQLGSVASFKKETGSTNVYHLINFINATTLDWRDNEGTQVEPILIEDIPLEFDSEQEVTSIWIASPDINACSPMELEFSQENSRVFLTVPMLKYWDIIVVNYDSVSSINEESVENLNSDYYLYQNYPHPFNPSTTIRYQIPHKGFVTLKVYDILGKEIASLVHEEKSPGRYEINFDAADLASGVYFYRLLINDYVDIKKMILLK